MSQPTVIPGQMIGILGGGQLGRMMALSARAMGYRIAVLDPGQDNPLSQIADVSIQTAYDDLEGAKRLAEVADVITYEFENVDLRVARQLEAKGLLPQGSALLAVTQDRVNEKKALSQASVKTAPYEVIQSQDELEKAIQTIGYPSVLKTARGGYDGKGQLVLRETSDLEIARSLVDGTTVFVLEQWVPFQKELSIMIARSTQGEIKTFPVVENSHIHNILHQTIAPARISERVKRKVEQVALEISESLNLVGVLGVEMFLGDDDEIYVNELAPRPHNSGHYTIEACETSQFEQHIRAICGWPLGSTEQLKPATMINLLGQHMEAALDAIPYMADSHFHLYGKDVAKQDRKMGHLTVLADTLEEALHRAGQLKIWNQKNMEEMT